MQYPFSSLNHQENLDDTKSYHSIDNNIEKQNFFKSFESDKIREINQKRKNPLPPVYPYEEMRKLKQSLKQLKKSSNEMVDNRSIRSLDSFVTVNEFQSICYEEGDFQKMMQNIKEQVHDEKQNKIIGNSIKKEIIGCNQEQKLKQNQSFRSIPVNKQIINYDQYSFDREIAFPPTNSNLNIKQSSLLNIAQIQDFQNQAVCDKQQNQQYELCEEIKKVKENERLVQMKQRQQDQIYQHEKSVQISHIDKVLNQSQALDNEMQQLTRQLNKIHQQNESMKQMQIEKDSTQNYRKQQELQNRYQEISMRVKQVQQNQTSFNNQISYFKEFMKKTKLNNSYLKKQVQFFKNRSKQIQEKQKKLIEKQNHLKQIQIKTENNSSIPHCFISQKNLKPKTFNIKPQKPNNQSYQSKKYKQFTFNFSSQNCNLKEKQNWNELQIDNQNKTPQYRIIYSFQQNQSLLIIRIEELLINQSSRSSISSRIKGKEESSSPGYVKKNYEYLIDFADNKYEDQNKKLKSLTKQLIINLNEIRYKTKEFVRKIEVFLMIKEQETYIDLMRVISLPNPLALYMDKRFSSPIYKNLPLSSIDTQVSANNKNNKTNELRMSNQNDHSENFNKQKKIQFAGQFCNRTSKANQNENEKLYMNETKDLIIKKLFNLHRFMKTYIIRIQKMADIESIQKLTNEWWINSGSCDEKRYFSIRNNEQCFLNTNRIGEDSKINSSNSQQKRESGIQQRRVQRVQMKRSNGQSLGNQVFYVKIEECVLQKEEKQFTGDEKGRYTITFKVASTKDNQLLLDLIEFLTFLTTL